MVLKAKETLEAEELNVLAEMGYFDGAEVKKCADVKITTYIPKPLTSSSKKRGLSTKDEFTYERDCSRCPQGEELTCRFDTLEAGRHDLVLRHCGVSRVPG